MSRLLHIYKRLMGRLLRRSGALESYITGLFILLFFQLIIVISMTIAIILLLNFENWLIPYPLTPVGPVITITPPATDTPAATPVASLASVFVNSEVQADGTVKNISQLSVNNSLGVGDVVLMYPLEMNLENSGTVRLSITPDNALLNLQSVTVPMPNSTLPAPFEYTDRIDIYLIMQAELTGAGFELTSDGQPQKIIISDRPTEWVWSLRPKQEGTHEISVRISIPVLVDGIDESLSTTIKNIPAQIKVTKSWQTRLKELLPVLIPAILAFSGLMIATYANNKAKEREDRIRELEKQVAQTNREREEINQELKKLKSIRKWQFWRR